MVMLVGAGLCLAALASVLVGLRKAGVAAAPEIKRTKGKSFEGPPTATGCARGVHGGHDEVAGADQGGDGATGAWGTHARLAGRPWQGRWLEALTSCLPLL